MIYSINARIVAIIILENTKITNIIKIQYKSVLTVTALHFSTGS